MALRVGRSRLPELLAARGMIPAEFARRLGVSDAFVSQVIKGIRSFSYEMALNAAYVLNCGVEELHEITFE